MAETPKLKDVYFYNDAWREYVYCREDKWGFWVGPSGRGDTIEEARGDYERQVIERLGSYGTAA
jgi:hypothetical protein